MDKHDNSVTYYDINQQSFDSHHLQRHKEITSQDVVDTLNQTLSQQTYFLLTTINYYAWII